MKSFFKKIPFFSLAFYVLFSILNIGSAIAQTVPAASEQTSCFEYYKFQSVQVSVGPDKREIVEGEKVDFSGELINENNYPIVDGYVFVRIGEKNPNYLTEGQFVVDEFIALDNIILDGNEKKTVSFSWTPPANLKSGQYRADFFFSVGKKFNLGGLPFSNEVVISFADFSLISNNSEKVSFDRSSTKINSVKYEHIGRWPVFEAGSKVSIDQTIRNNFNVDQKVDIKYDLFYWDSLNESDLINTKSESITLKSSSSQELTYIIPEVEKSVYYLRITALAENGQKSIVNIRLSGNTGQARLNYPGINKFPLKEGDLFTLFSCYHNTSVTPSEGTMKVSLLDKKGEEIGQVNYTGVFNADMSALKTDILSKKEYNYLKLKAEIFDKNGQSVDKYETEYNCDTLNSPSCPEPKGSNKILSLVYLLGIFISLFAISRITKKGDYSPSRKNILVSISVAIILILVVLLMTNLFFVARAQMDSPNPQNTSTTKSDASRTDFDLGFNTGAGNRSVYRGYINRNITVNLTKPNATNYSLIKNQGISFSVSYESQYFGSGGIWDTPNFNSIDTFYADGGRIGKIKWNTVPYSHTLVSSDSSVISCSGNNCTALKKGTARVTVKVAPATVDVDACSEVNNPNNANLHVGQATLTCKIGFTDKANELGLCDRDQLDCAGAGPLRPYNYNSSQRTFDGFEPYWDFTVVDSPTNLSATCPAPGTQATVSWSAVPGATGYALRANNNTNSWNTLCDGSQNSGDICENVTTNSKTFTGVKGASYSWWVHSLVGGTQTTPAAEGPNFTCEVIIATLTYNGNGNTSGTVPNPVNFDTSTNVIVSGNTGSLTKTGYTFSNVWNTQANGSGESYNTNSSYSILASTTLYAQWTPVNTYPLSYNLNGGSGTTPSTVNLASGATTTVASGSGLVRSGFTFNGWKTATSTGTSYGTGNTFIMGTAAVTLYAQWTPVSTYTLSYNGNGNTSGTAPTTINLASGATTTISNQGSLIKDNFTFSSWNTATIGNGTTYLPSSLFTMTPAASTTLYAQWITATTTTTYPLSYNLNGGSGTTPSTVNLASGATTTVAASSSITRTDYTFSTWSTSSTTGGNNYSPGNTFTMTPAASTTLYAQWVTATTTPFSVTCSSNVNPSNGTLPSSTSSVTVTWSANVTGGQTPYTFLWNFSSTALTSSLQQVSKSYSSVGIRYATTTVTDAAGKSLKIGCDGTIVYDQSNPSNPQTCSSCGGTPPGTKITSLSLSANPISVNVGSTTKLTWTIGGTFNSCAASASPGNSGWFGSVDENAASYNKDVTISSVGSNVFTLTCTKTGYSDTIRSVTVEGISAQGPSDLNCAVVRTGSSINNNIIDVNTDTEWKVMIPTGNNGPYTTELSSGYTRQWNKREGTELLSTPISAPDGIANRLNIEFGSVGLKTIGVTVASSTPGYVYNCSVNSSTATTSVQFLGDTSEI